MILAIDMGNTNIVLGGIDEKQTYFIERVTTDHSFFCCSAFKHYDLKCRRKGSRHPPSVSWLRYENRHEHPYGQP